MLITAAFSVSAQQPPPPPATVQTAPEAAPVTQTGLPPGIVLKPGERLLSVNGVPYNAGRTVYPTSGSQTGCPTCQPGVRYQAPSVVQSPQALAGLPHQATAIRRANYMAANRYRGHPPGSFGTNFEGVGWSSNRNATPPTCVPGRRGGVRDTSSGGWTLVGDHTARGDSGAYRVRLWNRTGNTTTLSQNPTTGRAAPFRRRGGGFLRRIFRR